MTLKVAVRFCSYESIVANLLLRMCADIADYAET